MHFVVSSVSFTSHGAEKWDVCACCNRHMGRGKSMFSVLTTSGFVCLKSIASSVVLYSWASRLQLIGELVWLSLA